MTRYVIDASVAVEYLLKTPIGLALADLVEHAPLFVPELLDAEVLSVLRGAVLDGRIEEGRATAALDDLSVRPLDRIPNRTLARLAWRHLHNVSAYDASTWPPRTSTTPRCSLLTAGWRERRGSVSSYSTFAWGDSRRDYTGLLHLRRFGARTSGSDPSIRRIYEIAASGERSAPAGICRSSRSEHDAVADRRAQGAQGHRQHLAGRTTILRRPRVTASPRRRSPRWASLVDRNRAGSSARDCDAALAVPKCLRMVLPKDELPRITGPDSRSDPPAKLAQYQVDWDVVDAGDVQQLETVLARAPDERELQTFLAGHPYALVLGVLGERRTAWVLDRPRFGAEYVPDFLIGMRNSLGPTWMLVELESPKADPLRKDGAIRRHFAPCG